MDKNIIALTAPLLTLFTLPACSSSIIPPERQNSGVNSSEGTLSAG